MTRSKAIEIMFGLVSVTVVVAGISVVADAQSRWISELPTHSIVNGKRLQPRENDLLSLGHPDVTPGQAAEINQLYHELLP